MTNSNTASETLEDLQLEMFTSSTSTITVNQDAVEPNEYFRVLKSNLRSTKREALTAGLNHLATLMFDAKDAGQEALLDKLAYSHSVIMKELELLALGYDKYVKSIDIKHLIDNVKPAKSIKMIELDRYQRIVPKDIIAKVAKLKEKSIFDGFVVVFTDLSNEKYETEKDKDYVKRNRDPIIFGYFKMPVVGMAYENMYFIADWEDEFCDLTFDRMMDKMIEVGIKNPYTTTNTNTIPSKQEVDALVATTLAKLTQFKDSKPAKPVKQSVFSTIKSWFN